jgi:hypothetical protein
MSTQAKPLLAEEEMMATIAIERETAWAAATDAGNRHARKGGHRAWNRQDYNAAVETLDLFLTRWTETQLAEIKEYAARLKDPEVSYHSCVGYAGMMTFEKIARYMHIDDDRCVAAWQALGMTGAVPEICAEIQLRMKARREAFRLAGLCMARLSTEN